MRTLRSLVVLLVIFVAFYLGAHYWIRWRHTVTNDVAKISRLVECEPNELRLLEIQQSAEGKARELKFERVDQPEAGIPAVTQFGRSEWKFVSPLQGEADATILRRIASTLCELYDPIPLRAEDFQGNPPDGSRRLLAGFAGVGGFRSLQFEFGPLTANRSSVIRFLDGKNQRVLRVPLALFQESSLPPEAYQNLRVMRMEGDNVQVISLSIDGKERFSLERNGADGAVMVGGKVKGAGSDEARRFLNRLASLRGLGVEDPAYSSADCQKGKARAVVSFRGVAGKEEALRFDYGKGGMIMACSTGRSSKYRVHRDLLQYLDLSAKSVTAK